jgi:hypothetical protein
VTQLPRRVFLWTFVLAIATSSLHTALAPELPHGLRTIGAAELVAVLMLVLPPTRVIGFALLLAVFAAAGLHHVVAGEWPFPLAIYAAGAWLIASGPKPKASP